MSICSSMKSSSKFIFAILPLICIGSCDNQTTKTDEHRLTLISEIDLDIPEPSGISLSKNGEYLWIVSDPPDNHVYKTSLQGDVIKKLGFQGDDLEGVWYDITNAHLWVVEEQRRELVELDTGGTVLNRYAVNYGMSSEYGFEGICRDNQENFWIANEKSPAQILYLDHSFKIINTFSPSMTNDISGLSWVNGEDSLWLVSDESRLLLKWLPDQDVVAYYDLPMEKPEGVAIDRANSRIYIVSDLEEKLYIFKLP